MTPERWQRLRWWLVYSACGLIVFVLALYLSFPFDRAKDVIVARAATWGVELEAGSVGAAFGPGVKLEDVRVRIPSSTPGGKATRVVLSSARILVSPIAQLFGTQAYDVRLEGLGGTIDVAISMSKTKDTKLAFKTKDVSLAEIPKESFSLPLHGTLDVDVKLSSSTGRYSDAQGTIEFTCNSCVIGDGKQPLKVPGNPFLAAGLTLPRIRLGDFGGRASIEKGSAKLQGVKASSPDLDIFIDGDVQLRDPIALSHLNLYVRFKPSDKLLATSEPLKMMLQMAAQPGKRPDGFYGVRLSGRAASPDPPVFTAVAPTASAPSLPSPRSGITRSPTPALPPMTVPAAPPPPPAPTPPPVDPAPPAPPPPPAEPTPPPAPAAVVPAVPAVPPPAPGRSVPQIEEPRRTFRGVPPGAAAEPNAGAEAQSGLPPAPPAAPPAAPPGAPEEPHPLPPIQ